MMSVKVREDLKRSTFFSRLLCMVVLIAVLSLLVSLLHPLRTATSVTPLAPAQAAAYVGGWSAQGGGFRYRCDQASKDTREAINYYADPCEDFHAFACSAARDNGQRQPGEESDLLKHALTELSFSNESQDVAVQAGVVFKSCLATPFFLNSTVERNLRDFFDVTKLTKETVLSSTRTPRDIFNFSALLSYNNAIKPFLSFETNASRTLTIRFSKPFSSYLNRNAMEAIFMPVAEAFYADRNARLGAVNNLASADEELRKVLAELKISEFSPAAVASAAEKYITSSEWQTILEAHTLHKEYRSDEGGNKTIGIEKVIDILLHRLKPEEAVMYTMAHALLPKEMVELFQEKDRSEACLRLVKDVFGTVWEDLETYILGFFDENHEAVSVATTVLATLKTMLSSNPRFGNEEATHTALAKLDKVRFDIPSAKDFVSSLGKSRPNLGNMSANSLYRNILLSQRRQGTDTSKNVIDRRRGRSGLFTTSMALPAESFKPFSFCHGHHNQLNYATLGVDLAAALLRYAMEPHDEGAPSSTHTNTKGSIISALRNVTACLERVSTHLFAGKMIQQVALRAVALQISMETIASRAIARTGPETPEEAPDAPAQKQTFFVKYCQAQCAKHQGRSDAPSLDATQACNLVVMNSPEFARLFNCEKGDQMVPAEYCVAL